MFMNTSDFLRFINLLIEKVYNGYGHFEEMIIKYLESSQNWSVVVKSNGANPCMLDLLLSINGVGLRNVSGYFRILNLNKKEEQVVSSGNIQFQETFNCSHLHTLLIKYNSINEIKQYMYYEDNGEYKKLEDEQDLSIKYIDTDKKKKGKNK